MKKLKLILKTPRLHFKHVEEADWESLQTMQKDYENTSTALMTEVPGVKREKVRAKRLVTANVKT